jgi:hypothetical protein
MKATRNDILGLIDYLNESDFDSLALYEDALEWHTRCVSWITEKLEQETNNEGKQQWNEQQTGN